MSRVQGKCRGFKNVGIFLLFKKKRNKQNKTKQNKNTERKKIKKIRRVSPGTRTAALLVNSARAVPLRHQANTGFHSLSACTGPFFIATIY